MVKATVRLGPLGDDGFGQDAVGVRRELMVIRLITIVFIFSKYR